MKIEIWATVPGWDRYEVSNRGLVRSKDMTVFGGRSGAGKCVRKGRQLALVKKGGRYLCVTLTRANERKQFFVHDLVLLAFVGVKPVGQCCRHLNDVKTDNRLENLAYGTHYENEKDKDRNGRRPIGDRHGCAKLSTKQVKEIRRSVAGPLELARQFGVSKSHVCRIRRGQIWRHLQS